MSLDREELRRRFAGGDAWFDNSPLYRVLARTVAGDDALLDLAALAQPGMQPANLLMGATHLEVLRDPAQPFARFFASVRNGGAKPPEAAAAEYGAFCAAHRDAIAETVSRRLVQTNVPGRGVSVRLAMHEVARRVGGPVAFLEIGPSAGIQLRFDRWALETGGRRFGPAQAQVTLTPQWRGDAPVPELDEIPPIRERLGIDLHPVDPTDPEERLWLKALVWPEHTDRFAQLSDALDAVAADPPEILSGDAIELLPGVDAARLPDDVPLVVFHAMVRIHVPAERREAFDAAIDQLARRRRLLHVSLELPPKTAPYTRTAHLLALQDSEGPDADLALAEGHGRWIEPL